MEPALRLATIVREDYVEWATQMLRAARRSVHAAQYVIRARKTYTSGGAGRIIRELCGAKVRGVNVYLYLHGGKPGNYDAKHANFVARWLIGEGIRVYLQPMPKRMHAKALIVDDEQLLLGSHNWTDQSLGGGFELSLYLRDPGLAVETRLHLEELTSHGHCSGCGSPSRLG